MAGKDPIHNTPLTYILHNHGAKNNLLLRKGKAGNPHLKPPVYTMSAPSLSHLIVKTCYNSEPSLPKVTTESVGNLSSKLITLGFESFCQKETKNFARKEEAKKSLFAYSHENAFSGDESFKGLLKKLKEEDFLKEKLRSRGIAGLYQKSIKDAQGYLKSEKLKTAMINIIEEQNTYKRSPEMKQSII